MRKVTTIREFDDYGNCIKEVVTDEEVDDCNCDTLLTRKTAPLAEGEDIDWSKRPEDTRRIRMTLPFGEYTGGTDGTGD